MKRILAVLAIVAMSVLSISSVAAAQYGSAQGTYVPSGGVVEGGVTTISGLEPGSTNTIQLFDGSGALIGTVTVVADAAGNIVVPVPAGAASLTVNGSAALTLSTPAPAPTTGTVTTASNGPIVTAAKSTPAIAASISTPVQPTISTGGPIALATTGSEVTTPLLLGGALIAVGGMAIIASKRRESGFSS